jgi:solute carrier family 31 (copper transporter), member 1
MFAGSCIGVIVLAMTLTFLRCCHRAFDALIARGLHASHRRMASPLPTRNKTESNSRASEELPPGPLPKLSPVAHRGPSVFLQALRALLNTAQFAVAYILMLLAMSYNGYIIICILIGTFLGYFVFEWGPMDG